MADRGFVALTRVGVSDGADAEGEWSNSQQDTFVHTLCLPSAFA